MGRQRSTQATGRRLERPIFVGGMSRSGTTVMGKQLLNRHPTIGVTKPAEMWFITNTGGLCDVVDAAEEGRIPFRLLLNTLRRGNVSPERAFRRRMEGFWYGRSWWKDGRQIGLSKSVSPDHLRAALITFDETFADDPREAGRQLVADLVDPSVRARGKQRWVDTTPGNAARADALYRMFPDLRLINMIRDGRDVAASVVSRGWGTDSYDRALRQWFDRVRKAHLTMASVPDDRWLTVRLERLTGSDQEEEFARILEHLQIEDSARMRRFLTSQMTVEASHAGRWRLDMSTDKQRRVNATYERMLADLRTEGVTTPD